MVNIIGITYAKADLEQVAANATHMNAEDRTQLIGLFKDFEYLFYGTIVYWDIEPLNLGLNSDSKPFNCKYYPVPRG